MKKFLTLAFASIIILSCAKKITQSNNSSLNEKPAAVPTVMASGTVQNLQNIKALAKQQASNTTDPSLPKPPGSVDEMANPRETPQVLEGKTIFKTKCVTCHEVRDPGAFTVAQWGKIIDWMAPRAVLTNKQKAEVLAYATLYAKR